MGSVAGTSRVSDLISPSAHPSQSLLHSSMPGQARSSSNLTLIEHKKVRPVRPLSPWSGSTWKRILDVTCVAASLPVSLPVFLITCLIVRLTSSGPILFQQERVGMNDRPFTILKFRTMPVQAGKRPRPVVTTSNNQEFTPIGPFLRKSKLDELPQLWNVLCGHLSLVGPRPKVRHHSTTRLTSRPGVTGRATLAFIREESVLAGLPTGQLDSYYQQVVLPLKQRLDEDYMAEATLGSDLIIILRSVLRRGNEADLRDLLREANHVAVNANLSMVAKQDNKKVQVVRAPELLVMRADVESD